MSKYLWIYIIIQIKLIDMGQCVLDTSNIKHINKINTLVVESTDTTVSNTEDDAGERTKSSVTGDGTSVTGIVMFTTSTQSIEDNVNDDDFLNENISTVKPIYYPFGFSDSPISAKLQQTKSHHHNTSTTIQWTKIIEQNITEPKHMNLDISNVHIGSTINNNTKLGTTFKTNNGKNLVERNSLSKQHQRTLNTTMAEMMAKAREKLANLNGSSNNKKTGSNLSMNSTGNATPNSKSHKTDAPLLNYIFDSHLASKHQHRQHPGRFGPHFEDVLNDDDVINATALSGKTAYLNCRISLLQDKTVSWMRRRQTDDEKLDLLTVGTQTYTGDKRYNIEFQYPNNWRLRIQNTHKDDEGLYECQISTYPPKVIRTYFWVQAPDVIIADEHDSNQPLVDKYYEVDSTMQLLCIAKHIEMSTAAVNWLHGDRMLNFDTSRGGISVKTDLMENGANSTLVVSKIRKSDSGNYTCSIGSNYFYTITVHVLNGESLAELYHGESSSSIIIKNISAWLLKILVIFIINRIFVVII